MQTAKTVKRNVLQVRSYEFSLAIIHLTANFPSKRVFWVIADQLLRSATSVGANIIEAKASSSKRDFIKYYQIALKSCNETEYWLALLRDAKLMSVDSVVPLLKESEELAKMLASSLLTMKGKRSY
jgi:four helix bundle protein